MGVRSARRVVSIVAVLGWILVLAPAAVAQPTPVRGDPLRGNGDVARTLLTYQQLTTSQSPSSPVAESAFAVPANAAPPRFQFEGTLTLDDVDEYGSMSSVSDSLCAAFVVCGEHLPPFTVQLVQNGSHLIPVQQGLIITHDSQPGATTYNLIVGPGRAWSENSDTGPAGTFSRASLPFALNDRNQNCVHNGVLTFLYNQTTVSDVRYQIDDETCEDLEFNMWGQLPATYTPQSIPGAVGLESSYASQVSHQMPIKPFSDLATDYPKAHLDMSKFGRATSTSVYGLVFRGVNYVSDSQSVNPACMTRFGPAVYCDVMRLPSYSVAKGAFASLALSLLTRLYGPTVPNLLLKDYIPQMASNSNWDSAPVTFQDTADMATGNYDAESEEADENGPVTVAFLAAESYSDKMALALDYPHHANEQGVTWIYHSIDAFLLAQAMTGFLQSKAGPDADVFNLVRDDVYEPIGWSPGALTTIRSDNAAQQGGTSAPGRPVGYFGLFMDVDDVAKLATFFQNLGEVDGRQLVSRAMMRSAMQRSATNNGVAAIARDDLGTGDLGDGDSTVAAGGSRYSNGLWAYPSITAAHGCAIRLPYFSGAGGITIVMYPNGATYYEFSDADDFAWAYSITQIAKLAPLCAPTKTTVSTRSRRVRAGHSIVLTARVRSATRSWAPTGTVQFEMGRKLISPNLQLNANGTATYTVKLTAGRHAIKAIYHPDFSADTGLSGSPAQTTLTSSCSMSATTCSVASTKGMKVGDTIVMGPTAGTDDSHVIASLTPTSITWIGAFQNEVHAAGQAVWVQNTAGGGFARSTSRGLRITVRAGRRARG